MYRHCVVFFFCLIGFFGSFSYACVVQPNGGNGFSSPGNLTVAPWQSGQPNLQITANAKSVSMTIDPDGQLDRLVAVNGANFQSISSPFVSELRQPITVSIWLAADTNGTSISLAIAPMLNNPQGARAYRRQQVVLTTTPQKFSFIDFTAPDNDQPALVIAGIDQGEVVYAGGANARIVGLIDRPDNLQDSNYWRRSSVAVTAAASYTSTNIVSFQDDVDGLLDKVTLSGGTSGYLFTCLSLNSGETTEASLMLSGNGTINVGIAPITNLTTNTVGTDIVTKSYVLTTVPTRVRLPPFVKPGTLAYALVIRGIGTGENVYAGGVRAYPNRLSSANNLSSAVWEKSTNLTVLANAKAASTSLDPDGFLDQLKAATGFNSQSTYAPLKLQDNETLKGSIVMATTTGKTASVAVSISPIENNPQGIPYPGTERIISLNSATPTSFQLDYFTKPADGRTAAVVIAGIDAAEDVFVGEISAYHPLVAFDENLQTADAVSAITQNGPGGCKQQTLIRYECLNALRLGNPQVTSGPNPDNIQILDAPGGRPGRALKFYTKPGDYVLNNTVRAEVATPLLNGFEPSSPDFSWPLVIETGKTYYIKTSYFIPAGEIMEPGGELSWQVHNPCDGDANVGASVQQIFVKNGTSQLNVISQWENWFESHLKTKNPYNGQQNEGYCNPLYFPPPPLPQTPPQMAPLQQLPTILFDTWVDVEVTWKPDAKTTSSTGYLKIKLNGTKVFERINAINVMNQKDPPVYNTTLPGGADIALAGYLKLGTYRYTTETIPTTITRTMYYGPTVITVDP
jgi:Polysaccharide lyase